MSVAKEGHDTLTQSLYREQGMGLRIPPGKRPAVLIIDMQYDFCDPEAPTTLWPSIGQTFAPIRRLCTAARERNIPIIYTQGLVAPDGSTAGLWRFKQRFHAEMRVQIEGSRGAEIIGELAPEPGDRVIRKWRPSAFFRTDLEVFLSTRGIDTLLCCGTSVSGCVRATVTDAFMRDIRCMVIATAWQTELRPCSKQTYSTFSKSTRRWFLYQRLCHTSELCRPSGTLPSA